MNDNETYTSLGFQSLLILNRLANDRALRELAKEQKEDAKRETQCDRDDEEKLKDQLRYVEQRLRELARWERRIGGKG